MDPTFALFGLFAILGLGFYITVIALNNKDKDVAIRAIKTLGKLRPAKAAPPLDAPPGSPKE